MTPFLVTLTSNLDKMGGHADALLAVAGVVGLLGAAWRWSVKLSKKFDIINDLVAHELNHNSGSSVKDKAYKSAEESTKAADAAERAVQGVNDLKSLLDGYVTASANEHKAIWNAIGVIQKAQH